MKSFQPKEKAMSEGDDDPGDPPDTNAPPTSSSEQSIAEPDPMTRPTRRSRNAEVDFRGERRSNATHASMTDPEARLFKKSPGAGAMLCFMGHSLMENRSGLIVQAELTQADGYAERRAAIDMLHRHSPGSTRRLTLAADRGYDGADFVAEPRRMVVTPHVAQKSRHSAIDGRTTRHPGYAKSQRRRKKIEEPFGWAKTVGGMAQTLYRGIERMRARLTLAMATCNLARLPKLLAA
jgi:Transposase DDE domain